MWWGKAGGGKGVQVKNAVCESVCVHMCGGKGVVWEGGSSTGPGNPVPVCPHPGE